MHSVLYPWEPRLLMQTWLPVCHYKNALSSLHVYKSTGLGPDYKFWPPRCMHTRAATWELPGYSGRFSNCMYVHAAALLQQQVLKLHVCACRCPAAAAGSQTAVTVMHWQDTKLHARMRTAMLPCCSGRIPNCMHECALLPCCSGSFTNCLIE
jgi:hypothetical protein